MSRCAASAVVDAADRRWEHAQVTIERDGRITRDDRRLTARQGNETTFAQMLADQFGIPIEHVTILHGDTGIVKQGIGTFGSRSQAVGGSGACTWPARR
jgi:carbon-monoxide dehydrogenase large subunit